MKNVDIELFNYNNKSLLKYKNVRIEHIEKNIYDLFSMKNFSFLLRLDKGDDMLLVITNTEIKK